MSKETITHEVKLQPAVIVVLRVMALGVLANAFPKASPIQDAMAEVLAGSISITHSGAISCSYGC